MDRLECAFLADRIEKLKWRDGYHRRNKEDHRSKMLEEIREDEIGNQSEGICVWKGKRYFLHSKTEVGFGEVATGNV